MRNPRLKARASTLQQPDANAPDFAQQISDILDMLAGTFAVDGVETHVTPGERGDALRPWVFGSSRGQSARVAAAFGLPFVASYHITPATALGRGRRLPRRVRPVGGTAGTLRGGVGGRGGRGRLRDGAAPGLDLRALGARHPDR